MLRLLLASNNPGKLHEIKALLAGLELELLSPADLGIVLHVIEDGQTYAENAARKARAFSKRAGLPALADDSGLEVEALDGAPGLYSARFSHRSEPDDADRRAYLLSRLQGHPQPWSAKFHCTVALATTAGEVYFAEGECPGEIIPQERGYGGFGYDPIFLIPETGLTMAELNIAEKNRLSHRAFAVQAAIPLILDLVSNV